MMTSGVYMITCSANGARYVGSSVNIDGRVSGHLKSLRAGSHQNVIMQRTWDKYGGETFSCSILEETESTRECLLDREQHYIDTLGPEMNICPVAGSRLGSRQPEGFGETISAKMTEVWTRPEHRERVSSALRGRKQDPELVARRTSGLKGQKATKAERERVSAQHTGNKYNLGRVWTEAQREAARQRSLQQWQDREKRENILRSRGLV
jgi:group I intron endonuclease